MVQTMKGKSFLYGSGYVKELMLDQCEDKSNLICLVERQRTPILAEKKDIVTLAGLISLFQKGLLPDIHELLKSGYKPITIYRRMR